MVIGFYGQEGTYGPFSNFYPATFKVGEVEYLHTEQYIMYQKAMFFNDAATAQRILDTKEPAQCKELGRQVSPFDAGRWAIHRWEVCLPGIYSKFVSNPELCDRLLMTDYNTIAECSPCDRIWGIGMGVSNPNVQDPKMWRGSNLLGQLLMETRGLIRQDKAPDFEVEGLTLHYPLTK